MTKHWITLSLVAVIIVGAVTAAFILSRPQGNEIMASVSITATQTTELGIEPGSGFELTSDYKVTGEDLRAMLDLDPPIEYELEGKGKNWKITPLAPLEKNAVYIFRVKNRAGETVQSFAFQTKSDLAVNTVYPQDQSTYVTTDTGIEITFNAMDVDLKDHFEIRPEVPGTFETSGYTVIFRPDAPLEEDNIYRVTLKKGLAAPNGMTLTEDYTFSFDTTGANADKWDYLRLRLTGDYSETFLPGDPLAVEMSSGSSIEGQQYDIRVHRYQNIDDYIREVKAHDAFYQQRYGRKTDYVADTTGLEEVASFRGGLYQKDNYWSGIYAVLPNNLPEGHYIVTISGKDTDGTQQFVQKLIQVCNLSVYAQSADGDTLVWVNDPATGKAAAGRTLRLADVKNEEDSRELTTQADGTAHVMTGETENVYLTMEQGGKTVYFQQLALSAQQEAPLSERFYTAVYTDREIYQPNDTIRFWGVVKPRRAVDTLPSSVYASLSSSWSWPENKLYSLRLDVAADGTFTGEMPVTGLKQDWYSFSINDGEDVYTTHSFEIGEYTKPPYVITVKTNKDYYYANEQIQMSISAAYFDGTPVAGGRLRISSYDLGLFDGKEGVVTLDAKGNGSFTASYSGNPYILADQGRGWQPDNISFTVSNADEEDVYISTSGHVTVLPSRIAAKIESKTPDSMTIYTAQLDPSKLADGVGNVRPLIWPAPSDYDRLAGAAADLPVTVKIHKVEYVSTPVGSFYDYVNKKTITKYKYDRVETVVNTIRTQTAGGKAELSGLPYKNGDNIYYWIEASFNGGILGDVQETCYYFNLYWELFSEGGRDVYQFGPQEYQNKAALGEEITLGLYKNRFQIFNEGRVLYTVLQRKMLTYGVFESDEQKLPMQEDFLPNVQFLGAYFDGRHVYAIRQHNVSYQYDAKKLSIEVKTDKASYKPGEKASITVSVTGADGKPVQAAVCVGVVDEAVFTLAPQTVDLAQQLYADVFYPDSRQSVSYVEYNLEKASLNDGGMGGGGGDGAPLREEFVDTALFQTARTDASGKAAIQLELPDNVTSWRVTAAAVTDDLRAGDNLANTVATLPFYLTPLFTESYLAGDDVSVAVGSVGTALEAGARVDYTVTVEDGDGAEIDRLTGTGKAGERVPFNLGKYDEGYYTITFSGKSGGYADAVRHPFSVIRQGITAPVIKNMPLSEVSRLASLRYPVTLTIYDERMEPFMTALEKLAAQDGDRTEVIAAAWRARMIRNGLLGEEDREPVTRDGRLDQIQEEDGGIRLLPFSEGDAAVTAKLLVAAPELVDGIYAEAFLQTVLKDPASTPDDRVMAYVGLAALKKPVLLDLQRMEKTGGLTTTQRLYLGVGLARLGDFEGARAVYESLGKALVSEGSLKYVEGDGTAESRLQNTAAALMLASCAAHPDADALMRFFNAQDDDRSKNQKVLYNLETLAYLEEFKAPQGKDAGKFSYMLDGKEQQVELGELGLKPMSLSYEAFKAAGFRVLSGKVYANAAYIDYAAQAGPPQENSLVKIERTYTPLDGELKVSSRVRVDLKVTFDPSVPEGCYSISDYIPSGMRFVPSRELYYSDIYDGKGNRGFVDNEGQKIYGSLWRSKDEEQPLDGQGKALPGEPYDPENPETDPNVYTFTYYLNASLAGDFVTESACVTPYEQGAGASTGRGKITIKP